MPAAVVASLFVVLLATSGSSPLPFHRLQESTPTVSLPATPSPDACAVAPREAEAIRELLGPPEPIAYPTTDPEAPATRMIEIPVGQPGDPGIEAGVVTTVYEFFACSNAGDMRRAFALGTDHYIQHYGGSGSLTDEDIAFLTGDPVPVPAEFHTAVIAVTNITVFVDGRAGAFVTIDTPFEGLATEYTILAWQGKRWLIDEVIELR
jgi:hypothetical protein